MFYICGLCEDAITKRDDNWIIRIYDDKISREIRGHRQCIESFEKQIEIAESEHKGKREMTVQQIFDALDMDINIFPSLSDVKREEYKEID